MRGRIIIIGIIATAVLGGLIWYYNWGSPGARQTASLLEKEASQEQFGPVESEFILGDSEAPVTMIEYSSPLCGHCVNFHKQTLPLIIDKYIKTGKVKLIPRIVAPLELSNAILCAQEQGKFWPFNEHLFEQAQEIKSTDDVKTVATNLGLEQEQFNQCFDEERYKERVVEWFNQANEAGVKGTPTFFIGDQQIVGNQIYGAFEAVIEQELGE